MIGKAAVLKIDFGRIQSRISGSPVRRLVEPNCKIREFDKGDGNRGGEK